MGAPKTARANWLRRPPRPDLAPDPLLPRETRLWAALQDASGGTWAGCVFDEEAIIRKLRATDPTEGQGAVGTAK